MRVSDLYGDGPVRGRDTFIVGTGPSMTVFPLSFLEGKTCILLNDAAKLFPSLGPVAFSNLKDFVDGVSCPYVVVKGRLKYQENFERTDNHVPWDHPLMHVFSYRDRRHDPWDHLDDVALWKEQDFYWNIKGGCSAIFALQFALLAGARSVTFVGCDCARLSEQDYIIREDKRQRKFVKRHFHQYAVGAMRVVKSARTRFPGVPIMSLTPFMGLGYHEEQFRELRS